MFCCTHLLCLCAVRPAPNCHLWRVCASTVLGSGLFARGLAVSVSVRSSPKSVHKFVKFVEYKMHSVYSNTKYTLCTLQFKTHAMTLCTLPSNARTDTCIHSCMSAQEHSRKHNAAQLCLLVKMLAQAHIERGAGSIHALAAPATGMQTKAHTQTCVHGREVLSHSIQTLTTSPGNYSKALLVAPRAAAGSA